MKTAADNAPLAIPPDLLAEIQAQAEAGHRPAGEVLRDLIERGLSEQRWQAHAEQEDQRAREMGILDDEDDQPMTDEYRQTLREKIAQGVRSLREGRVTDGPAFMARMDAELAELERQGH
jgi:Arc/MetJ-type ribon-helix-helix transcriptional regulator